MGYVRDMVILATSFKHHSYCIAGKDVHSGEWIRPVSTSKGGALGKEAIRVQNPYGTFQAKPLQRVIVPFEKSAPLKAQPENHLVAPGAWRQKYKVDRQDLEGACDHPEHLWMYDDHYSDRFAYDRLDASRGASHQSLYLIFVESIRFKRTRNYSGRPSITGSFQYRGERYGFKVTDPNFAKYFKADLGYEWEERNRFLCLSLTDAFEGYCYKLIAAVL